jgi:hypothetical protein
MLQGDFSTLGLPEVLQIIGGQRKTGMLTVVATDAERTIYFNDGRVVLTQEQHDRYLLERRFGGVDPREDEELRSLLDEHRESGEPLGRIMVKRGLLDEERLSDELTRQTEDQLYALFHWIEGAFNFMEIDISSAGAVVHEIDTTELVVNAARQIDEWRRVRALLPDLEVVVKLASAAHVSADETREAILSLIPAGGISVKGLCAVSEQSELETCRALADMFETGAVEFSGEAKQEAQ